MVGKFHLQSSGKRTEPRLDDGYRYWKFSHAPRDDWQEGHDYADWVREKGADLGELLKGEENVPTEFHQTTWTSDRAIEFISEERGGPWFLTLNPYDPHPPFIPPKTYAERFDAEDMPGPYFRESDLEQQEKLVDLDFQTKAQWPEEFDGKKQQAHYYAMVAQIDDQFARILRHLDDTGQRDNTIIIFTSDHGESLGDHGLQFKGCRFYEGLVRVPLIFSWPGQFQAGLRSDALVELIDMSATLLDCAGVELPEQMQGGSLLPILNGSAPPQEHRDFVRSEYFDALDSSFCPGDGDQSFATMYRDRRFKLVVYHGHQLGELYDLQNDPWEFDNLWEDPNFANEKLRLIHASFNASMTQSIDVGSRRIAPM